MFSIKIYVLLSVCFLFAQRNACHTHTNNLCATMKICLSGMEAKRYDLKRIGTKRATEKKPSHRNCRLRGTLQYLTRTNGISDSASRANDTVWYWQHTYASTQSKMLNKNKTHAHNFSSPRPNKTFRIEREWNDLYTRYSINKCAMRMKKKRRWRERRKNTSWSNGDDDNKHYLWKYLIK